MKKVLMITLILAMIIPATLFAKGPTDLEVQEATVAVLSVFGLVFMSSMFGQTPDGVIVDMDMETGRSVMEFSDFNVDAFVASMSEMMEQTPEEEQPVFSFNAMTGTIIVDEEGNLNLDMELSGGNVKTLEMKTSGDDMVMIEANGKDYSHLNEIFQAMEEEE